MPPAKKSTSRATRSRSSASRTTRSRASSSRTTRSRVSFKEPAALKRLHKSLESANAALGDLQKQSGRELSKSARDLYKDLSKVVSNARRNSGRLGTALQRDFEQAQKRLKQGTNSRSSTAKRSTSSRGKTATKARRRPATRSRRTTSRTSSSRSTTRRATAR
jgi:hypothetical protein